MKSLTFGSAALAIRYGFTGATALLVVFIPSTLGIPLIQTPDLLPAAMIAGIFGFLIDAASAYKAHPTYRNIRQNFFLAVAQNDSSLKVTSPKRDTIERGELVREKALWDLPIDRRSELKTEHAICIATFHVHMIFGAGALALCASGITGIIVTESRSWSGLIFGTSAAYAVLSLVFLRAATARLKSYNLKVLELTNQRTKTHDQSFLITEVSRLVEGLKQPERVWQAFQFASQSHRDQVRDNGEPYISHPVRVALSIRNEFGEGNTDTLVLALLHDVLEGKPNHRPDIGTLTQAFGPDIVNDCRVLTEKTGATRAERDENYSVAIKNSTSRVKLIKCADRLDNVRDLLSNPSPKKVERYLKETEKYYTPLAESTSRIAVQLLENALKDVKSSISPGPGKGVGKS